jgi:hypothetical protein
MAQSARATNNILFRTLMVRTATEQASMFSVDVDGREYWITVKHLLTGAKHMPVGSVAAKRVSLFVLDPSSADQRWIPNNFSVLDPGKDIDIVVLAPEHSIRPTKLNSLPISAEGAPIGGECEFLGFPFAGAWMANLKDGGVYRMPFIKHCYLSGQINEPQRIWVLDGVNNEGFSGGPVVIFTGAEQKILGVVSGFRTETSDVVSVPIQQQPTTSQNGKQSGANRPVKSKNVVNMNAGLIFAFDASYALEAIKKNPIGPVVEQSK